MQWINYHHLLYFWMVAKEGSIAAAAKRLRLSQPTISTQLRTLENALDVSLFDRSGRRLVLTEEGQLALRYAEEIFGLGRELLDALRDNVSDRPVKMIVGVTYVIPKLIAYELLRPALSLEQGLAVECHEDRFDRLLGRLSRHELDMVLSDDKTFTVQVDRGDESAQLVGSVAMGAPADLLSEDFILDESARYLSRPPGRDDVRSVWVGMRPLVKPQAEDGADTKALSREHTVLVGRSGLVTVTGGKWTTYRAMAEDVLARCVEAGRLPDRGPSRTARQPLVGTPAPGQAAVSLAEPPGLHLYGADASAVQALPGSDTWLAPGLSEAMVRFAARHEYARSVEDVLARRSRWLFLDAAVAQAAAPAVARVLQEELGRETGLDGFVQLAASYRAEAASPVGG